MIAAIGIILILLPLVGFVFDGKDSGNIWLGVKYILAFVAFASGTVLLLRIFGFWIVLIFPILFLVALIVRKQMHGNKRNDSLDSRE